MIYIGILYSTGIFPGNSLAYANALHARYSEPRIIIQTDQGGSKSTVTIYGWDTTRVSTPTGIKYITRPPCKALVSGVKSRTRAMDALRDVCIRLSNAGTPTALARMDYGNNALVPLKLEPMNLDVIAALIPTGMTKIDTRDFHALLVKFTCNDVEIKAHLFRNGSIVLLGIRKPEKCASYLSTMADALIDLGERYPYIWTRNTANIDLDAYIQELHEHNTEYTPFVRTNQGIATLSFTESELKEIEDLIPGL